MRITFTFPKEYPHRGPDSTPVVSLEPNPLISINDRARILRKLKTIRESRRPCLEPCLRFLLFKNEDVDEKPIHLDSGSSDEEDEGKRREQEHTVALLRNNKNLAEPRTTQGVFGPNGAHIFLQPDYSNSSTMYMYRRACLLFQQPSTLDEEYTSVHRIADDTVTYS